MLRAFSIFFQLANIAEQHHRLRRRRQYEHEGRVPRESLADAVARLREAGVGDDELRAAARARGRPVLTAHPTEASRRTILQAHQRLATALRRLDDPELPHSTQRRVREQIAEEMTILWQTDEVRSRRPRVVDEIRNGLWFVEASLWQALPRLVRELREAIPGAPPPLRLGTWIGGDMDGNPNAGADTIVDALERARTLARDLLRRDVRLLGAPRGECPPSSSGDPGPTDARLDERRAVPRRARPDLGAARRRRRTATPRSSRTTSPASTPRFARTARARVADGALADLRARVEVFGLHVATLDLRVHCQGRAGAEPEHVVADVRRGRRGARTPRAARDRPGDRLDDRDRRRRARGRDARARGGPERAARCRCSRRSTTYAARASLAGELLDGRARGRASR